MADRFHFVRLICIALLVSCSATEKHSGCVVKVIDGDTIEVLMKSPNEKLRIRLFGIDAPERGQAFYNSAKKFTASMVANKDVKLVVNNKDRYGRMVADVYLADGTHINAEIVKAGYAWHYEAYSDNVELAQWEVAARQKKLGLWQDTYAQPPWEFRKDRRK